jgi:hypothetical protein
MDPGFLNPGTSWRWVVSFASLPLYPMERSSGTQWIGGLMGRRAGLNDMKYLQFLNLLELELGPLGRPTLAQSLYRLSYRGLCISQDQAKKLSSYLNVVSKVWAPCRGGFQCLHRCPLSRRRWKREPAAWGRDWASLSEGDISAMIWFPTLGVGRKSEPCCKKKKKLLVC